MDRTAAGKAAQAKERAHETVRRNGDSERCRHRERRRPGNSALVTLARVVFREELVEP